jgi:hypothetical protein
MPRCTSREQHTASTNAGELDQDTVSGGVEYPAAISLDRRINQLGAERTQAAHRTFFVRTGQP